MNISITMKKIILVFIFLSASVGIVAGVLFFLPNELTFKIYNAQAIAQEDNVEAQSLFAKAKGAFPHWSLIAQNNSYGRLYEEQKYDELIIGLDEIIKKECNIESEKISEYCENIFYLDGLVQYRLGENEKEEKQRDLYQKAIYDFQKALIINPENSWAQENIDFIMNEYQQQQPQQQEQGAESEEGEQGEQGDGEQQDGQSEGEQQQKQSSEDGGEGEEGEQGSGQQSGTDSESESESRLPQDMQQALGEMQQQLEDDQVQQGFNRSQSAAQKNNLENQDPFEQMMQQFFGGNPRTQEQKNLDQTIADPNEKDW